MKAQPFSSPARRNLYRVDGVDSRNAVTPENAPPPRGIPLGGAPPEGAVLDDPVVLRMDHPLYEHDDRAAWLADQLLMPGSIFHGKVHVAGDKAAQKAPRSTVGSTHVTHTTFTSIVGKMLHQSAYVEEVCLPAELISDAILQGPHSLAHQKVEQGGQLLAGLFRHYWRAVATAFSEAWDDPYEHLLWNPHGLTAFARLGGNVVHDQVAAYDIRQHYFDEVLERVADSVSLAKADHADVPARRLSEHLFQQLTSARHVKRTARPGLIALPGGVADINWGSSPAPKSPSVTSVPIGPEN